MEGSDSSNGRLDYENLRDQITRRKLLLGAAALGGGSILRAQTESTRPDGINHLAQAENRLLGAAELINNTDLADPRQTPILYDEISNTVDSVTNVLGQHGSDGGQGKQEIASLRAAIDYYNTLATALNTGATLSGNLADSERNVLYQKGSLGYDPITEFDSEAFKESIGQLTQNRKNTDAITSEDRKLVPNQQQVIDSLSILRDVFDRHLTVQQSYLDTATAIEAGIRAQEKSQFDTARSKLTEAHESLNTGIPKMEVSYRFATAGLSLDQYATLLTLRQEGVSKLLNVCDESVPEHQRRAVTNTALGHFFEARRLVPT